MGKKRVFSFVLFTGLLGQLNMAFGAADPTFMRALHMGINCCGTIPGIRTSVSTFLDTAQLISATGVQVHVSRSSFVDSNGITKTNDVAQVDLAGVAVGSNWAFSQAGFWVVRDADTHEIFVQFRPSLDPSLAEISGFAADITFSMPADGAWAETSMISLVSGAALDYVAAVVAHAPGLVQASSFSLSPPATFDQASVIEALTRLRTRIQLQRNEYFEF
jgi:hypothetical protein